MIVIFAFLIASQNPPELIGIMGAMDIELTLIKEEMLVEKIDTVSKRVFAIGKINDIPCVCVKAGVGKVNAALTAEILLMKYGVDVIIFTGVAGGINPSLNIGDIVISRRVVHHDFGQIKSDEFFVWDTIGFYADSIMVDMTFQAACNVRMDPVPEKISNEKGRLPKITIGVIATGDQFIASEEKRKWIEQTLHADCVEMEGAAVAQVCIINDIPFVIIRSLSDLANEEANVDFESFVIYAAKNSCSVVKEILNLLKK